MARTERIAERRERVMGEALEDVYAAIDYVAVANWPGRDEDAKRMVDKAFEKLHGILPASRQ